MDTVYDEIISDNPFYVELKNEFTNLFHHCITQSWIICVPRIGSLKTRVFTAEDIGAHILIASDELPETHYNTLTERQVTVVNKVITLDLNNSGLPLQSHILFEETFYTDDYIKYKVWCIETPLEPAVITHVNNSTSNECLLSINDCIDLLWTQSAGRQVLEQIEHCVQNYLKKNSKLPVAIRALKDSVGDLYTQCLQVALQNRRLRERSRSCKQMLDNIKLAVESYMQHLIYKSIFKWVCTCTAYEDAHLNKAIRNLADIQLKDLDIRKDIYKNVPKAKQILSKINTYNTILEKVVCVKNALNAISRKEKSDNNSLLTADDMLPVFVFLVIKSGLPNWHSQLTYMKEFRFSRKIKNEGDEGAYLVTTLEAVIQHIQSGALAGSPNPESYFCEGTGTDDNVESMQQIDRDNGSTSTDVKYTGDATLDHIFELIKVSHYDQVKTLLLKNQKYIDNIEEDTDVTDFPPNSEDVFIDEDDDDSSTELCHPLCNCKRCCRAVSRKRLQTSPTVTSRDSHGLTALHVACIHGKANIVELLITMGANIDATDLNECTPLHHAASRGHQNALLLLVHLGGNINKQNIDKNSPLHMAANNGHLNCVKALIYFAEYSRSKLEVNISNENGDTPLHMASKWGYGGIATILIENGAEPSIQNKKNKSAFDYAHNYKILKILKCCSPNLYEYIHITSNQKVLNCEVDSVSSKKSQVLNSDTFQAATDFSKSFENMKRIERILRAISYGDVKLACFYMNINYAAFASTSREPTNLNEGNCHPLCECYICKKRLELKSDFDVNFSDIDGYTALHFAARYGFNELCEILMHNNANVNAVNKNGQTPLHLAALNNKVGTLRLLLDGGADVNATNVAGNTALHDASQKGNIGAAKILLSNNPDVSILNALEKSALDEARDRVHLTIIDLINKHLENLKIHA